jgi:ribose transport system substrate-binding protein
VSSTRFTSRQTRRAAAALGALALIGAGLTGCGNDDSAAPASSSAAGASGSDASSTLAAEVEALTKAQDKYPVPTEKVTDISGVKGKVIYYVPISLQAPQFAATQNAVKAAAEAVGASVQVCDGKGTPTDVSACVEQATQAGAAGVIADAIPYGMASNALDAAQEAGIPVVIGNQLDDAEHPAAADLAYVNAPGAEMMEALAKWIQLDSNDDATILVNQTADSPAPPQFVTNGTKFLATDCGDCKVITNDVSSANFSQVPASTSAALLKNPNVNYVVSQFEQFLQVTNTGIQQASKTDSVKVVTGAVQVSGLKQLASGTGLDAASGQASVFGGWVYVDAILRMHSKQDVPKIDIPVRLFTKDSIKDLNITDEAQASGEWFGPATYTDDFKAIWGVS